MEPQVGIIMGSDSDWPTVEPAAEVFAEFGVPCRLIKAVTDNADEGAMEWPALVDAAARRLGRWLERNVAS